MTLGGFGGPTVRVGALRLRDSVPAIEHLSGVARLDGQRRREVGEVVAAKLRNRPFDNASPAARLAWCQPSPLDGLSLGYVGSYRC